MVMQAQTHAPANKKLDKEIETAKVKNNHIFCPG
jgi:hypothetical protein